MIYVPMYNHQTVQDTQDVSFLSSPSTQVQTDLSSFNDKKRTYTVRSEIRCIATVDGFI